MRIKNSGQRSRTLNDCKICKYYDLIFLPTSVKRPLVLAVLIQYNIIAQEVDINNII